jgi:hypothetical protein
MRCSSSTRHFRRSHGLRSRHAPSRPVSAPSTKNAPALENGHDGSPPRDCQRQTIPDSDRLADAWRGPRQAHMLVGAAVHTRAANTMARMCPIIRLDCL